MYQNQYYINGCWDVSPDPLEPITHDTKQSAIDWTREVFYNGQADFARVLKLDGRGHYRTIARVAAPQV